MMKRTLVAAVLCVTAGSAALTLNNNKDNKRDEGREKTVKLADTPAAVQSSIKKVAGDAKIAKN